VNPSILSGAGHLFPNEAIYTPEGVIALVEIPPDFHAVKQFDIGVAKIWREHARDGFTSLWGRAR
jgi:predicted GNAT superfamily acetyltransferase